MFPASLAESGVSGARLRLKVPALWAGDLNRLLFGVRHRASRRTSAASFSPCSELAMGSKAGRFGLNRLERFDIPRRRGSRRSDFVRIDFALADECHTFLNQQFGSANIAEQLRF